MELSPKGTNLDLHDTTENIPNGCNKLDRVAHLVLTFHWFDEIASGRKRIEYRKAKPYWMKRVWDRRVDILIFHRGYTDKTMRFKLLFKALRPKDDMIELYLGERLDFS